MWNTCKEKDISIQQNVSCFVCTLESNWRSLLGGACTLNGVMVAEATAVAAWNEKTINQLVE